MIDTNLIAKISLHQKCYTILHDKQWFFKVGKKFYFSFDGIKLSLLKNKGVIKELSNKKYI